MLKNNNNLWEKKTFFYFTLLFTYLHKNNEEDDEKGKRKEGKSNKNAVFLFIVFEYIFRECGYNTYRQTVLLSVHIIKYGKKIKVFMEYSQNKNKLLFLE